MRSPLGSRYGYCWHWKHNTKCLPICSECLWPSHRSTHSPVRVPSGRHKPKHFHRQHCHWHRKELWRCFRLFLWWVGLRFSVILVGTKQIVEIRTQLLLPRPTPWWFQHRRLELPMGRRGYFRHGFVRPSERRLPHTLLQSSCFSPRVQRVNENPPRLH